MRKLILQEWITLDGYVADKNGGLDFFGSDTKYSDADQSKFLETVDTILLGRKTYELFIEFWPNATNDQEVIADQLNTIPKIVVSNTLQTAPWGNWNPAQILRGDVVGEIKKLKLQEGKNIILWGSISLAENLINENLVDEYHLQVCPILLGEGRTLFPKMRSSVSLQPIGFKKYDSGVIYYQYSNISSR
jgi:dihydrofolate reductase